MSDEDEIRHAMRPLSFLLLSGGVFCLVPYLLMMVGSMSRLPAGGGGWVEIGSKRSLTAAFLLLGAALLSVPFSALRAGRRGGGATGLRTLSQGLRRCGPIVAGFVLLLGGMLFLGRMILVLPGMFGAAVAGYSLWLLKRDRASGPA